MSASAIPPGFRMATFWIWHGYSPSFRLVLVTGNLPREVFIVLISRGQFLFDMDQGLQAIVHDFSSATAGFYI